MAEWMKVGMDVVTGGAVGVVDQLLQNQDDKRAAEKLAAGTTLGMMGQYGTYYNYGLPLLAIVANAMGWVKGDWAARLTTAGSVLAGRKVTWQFTKRKEVPGYTFTRVGNAAELEARRREAEARARALAAAGGHRGQISEFEIPVVSGGQILR